MRLRGSLKPLNMALLKARPDAGFVDPVCLELELRRDPEPVDSIRLCRSSLALREGMFSVSDGVRFSVQGQLLCRCNLQRASGTSECIAEFAVSADIDDSGIRWP